MSIPFDIVIYAIVAVGLVIWLRGVLGTRHGDERQRPNPFAQPPSQQDSRRDSLSRPAAAPLAPSAGFAANAETAPEDRIGQIARLASGRMLIASSAVDGLREVARLDRNFDIDRFFHGAEDAFILIVESFAKGDRETLKGLLHDTVYKSFESVITDRAQRREKSSVDVHAVRKVEIAAARVEQKTAFVTIRFVADETVVLRDENDKVLEGNPDRVTENIDIWTFGRDLRSHDPTWLVFETREDVSARV